MEATGHGQLFRLDLHNGLSIRRFLMAENWMEDVIDVKDEINTIYTEG